MIYQLRKKSSILDGYIVVAEMGTEEKAIAWQKTTEGSFYVPIIKIPLEDFMELFDKSKKRLKPNQEWHEISQKEANEMKNFNKGMEEVLKILLNYQNK